MPTSSTKLIILRGNSGSGKSSVAQAVRAKASGKIALIEQDYLRRIVLEERETAGADNIEFIRKMVEFSLARGYHVILEGILASQRYSTMLKELITMCPDHYVYYFDVSFEETLRRHATKSNANKFGEKEMRNWYKERDLLGVDNEQIIPETSSLQQSVASILQETHLFVLTGVS